MAGQTVEQIAGESFWAGTTRYMNGDIILDSARGKSVFRRYNEEQNEFEVVECFPPSENGHGSSQA